VLLDLQHGLSAQGIDACAKEERPQATPLATLNIELRGDSKANVEILVQDSVTHKRVSRELDLAKIPSDGRELAVAIEADELLRASWAELALDTERARSAKPRPEVVKSVGEVLAPARIQQKTALEARGAVEYYWDGITLLGADAAGRIPLGGRFQLELAGGVRLSPAQSSMHGSVSALAAGGGARLLLRLTGDEAKSLHLGAGLTLSRIDFRGAANASGESDSYADWLSVARASLLGRLALGRVLGLSAGVSCGGTLRSVEATDAGSVAASARGLELGAMLGLEAR